jgi:DNA-directed RNA polymerase sigma subunit (sigma70/sigma32)
VVADGSALVSLTHDPTISDPAVETVEHEAGVRLQRALARLPERQRKVVTAQWGLDGAAIASATEVAHELELSPRRTQTIAQDALRALRRELEPAEASR